MQSTRINNRLPQIYRACRPSVNNTTSRNMATFYPRFVAQEFNPVFRFLEDLQTVSRPSRCGGRYQQRVARSFQPRFDVTESKDVYELKGELPGIAQENIEVVFTDEKTLTIKGRTASKDTQQTAQAEIQAGPAKTTEGESEKTPVAVSDESETSSYHKASVEEEYVDVASESEATVPADTPKATESEKQEVAAALAKAESSRRWVSERYSGSFQRSFTFPRRIDQEAVSASLKDGILSVVIPKAAVPENKRIAIQ